MLIKHHTTVLKIEQSLDRLIVRYVDGTSLDCLKMGDDLSVCYLDSEGTVLDSETKYGYYGKGKA